MTYFVLDYLLDILTNTIFRYVWKKSHKNQFKKSTVKPTTKNQVSIDVKITFILPKVTFKFYLNIIPGRVIFLCFQKFFLAYEKKYRKNRVKTMRFVSFQIVRSSLTVISIVSKPDGNVITLRRRNAGINFGVTSSVIIFVNVFFFFREHGGRFK